MPTDYLARIVEGSQGASTLREAADDAGDLPSTYFESLESKPGGRRRRPGAKKTTGRKARMTFSLPTVLCKRLRDAVAKEKSKITKRAPRPTLSSVAERALERELARLEKPRRKSGARPKTRRGGGRG